VNTSKEPHLDPAESLSPLIDSLLDEQQRLTAVTQFAQWHDGQTSPLLEPSYRHLIPLNSPRPGEQYAFEVDLDRCSGCKGCVTACHALNGLDEDESWREVGLLLGEAWMASAQSSVPSPQGSVPSAQSSVLGAQAPVLSAQSAVGAWDSMADRRLVPFQQTVTTACHHCLEPACLSGCPVLAYDKDPSSGIVRHLDDQCIGCSYCLMMCPYEVPKYSPQRGIVRKCDLCHGRLAAQEAPACVQACPNEAIRITLVETGSLRSSYQAAAQDAAGCLEEENSAGRTFEPEWLPDSPDPGVTLPTTRYVSRKRQESQLLAADHGQPRLAPRHWPLVLMLVLTQSGAGGLLAALHLGQLEMATGAYAVWCAGLGASVLHLGQPLKAWRIWLGWRRSWLSREAIALGGFSATAAATLALFWSGAVEFKPDDWQSGSAGLIWLLTALGLVVMGAQTMVYADTRRAFWRATTTCPRFLGTMLLAGCGSAFCIWSKPAPAAALATIAFLKLAVELSVLKHGDTDAMRWTALRRTAALQTGALRGLLTARLLLLLIGAFFMPFAIVAGTLAAHWAGAALLVCLLGETAERVLFFASVAPDKMPGLP